MPRDRNGLGWLRSGFDRFHIEHFIRGAKAGGFVEASAFLRGVEGNDADTATARLCEGELDEVAGEMAAAVFGLDVDVEQVAARGGTGIERMRGPVEQEEASTSDDFAIVLGEPTEVVAIGDGLGDPRFVGLGHELEDLIVAAASVDKHAAAVVGDERRVGSGRQPRLHDEQYRA
jgi:hypothetical protein